MLSTKISRWCILALAVSVAVFGKSACAEPRVPVALEMSLANNAVAQGEPIVVDYKIINNQGQDLYPDIKDGRNQPLDGDGSKWFSLQLKDEKGTLASSVSFLPAALQAAYSTSPRIPAGGSYSGSLIVSQWVAADHPGRYTLSVHIALPCTLGQDASLSWFPLKKDFAFSVIVTPADINRLRFRASALRAGWLAASDPRQRSLALKSLFALPEQTALPEWQALVVNDALNSAERDKVAKEISQTNSLEAVDLLAQLCWGTQKQEGTPIILYLSSMWQHGNVAMKKHIEELAAAHGERMPFVPLLRLD